MIESVGWNWNIVTDSYWLNPCEESYYYAVNYYISATLKKIASEPDYSSVIGSEVSGEIDRPLGTVHPRHPGMIYPINYGFVNGVFAADGEEQDIYLFNENKPVKNFTGNHLNMKCHT